MEETSLREITSVLEKALKELTISKIVDSKLRSKYAEYLVAHELVKRGYNVQISNERENTNADIYIADKRKRVEVKSGKYDEKGWIDASFRNGSQISDNKFDYCVFITFDESDESKVNEIFIFTKEELREVAKRKRCGARFPKTNPCLLLRCQSFKEYEEHMNEKGYEKLKIECDLNKNPQKYDQAWDKIK